jgi:hypothetical protein
MNVNKQHFAKLLGLSPRQLGRLVEDGLVVRMTSGKFCLETCLPILFRQLRDRLTLAEALCRRWAPGELEARWQDRGRRPTPKDAA